MDSAESTAGGSWPWDDWLLAFVWILMTPIVTVPVSAAVFDGLIRQPEEIGLTPNSRSAACRELFGICYEYAEFSPTLLAFILPGLMNLLPILWILSARPRARLAGVVAGLLGLFRLSIPVMVLLLGFDRITAPDGGSYLRWASSPLLDLGLSVPEESVWTLGALAWMGCLIVLFLFWTLPFDVTEEGQR